MRTINLKKKRLRNALLNQIYIKYFIQLAGNDNLKIKKEQEKLIKQLEKLTIDS